MLDTTHEDRDPADMAEDADPKKVAAEAEAPAEADVAKAEVEDAKPEKTPDAPLEEEPKLDEALALPATPPAPVNMVHEWMAAVVIMVFLSLFVIGFVYYIRGSAL